MQHSRRLNEQEPHIYRMTEAVLHYGEAIKAIMNEELGDGTFAMINLPEHLFVLKFTLIIRHIW